MSRFISKLRTWSPPSKQTVGEITGCITFVSVIGGSAYGMYAGVEEAVQRRSVYDSRLDILAHAFPVAFIGGLVGGFAGFAWPISMPVMLYTRAKRS